jgi:hypothetical protein
MTKTGGAALEASLLLLLLLLLSSARSSTMKLVNRPLVNLCKAHTQTHMHTHTHNNQEMRNAIIVSLFHSLLSVSLAY